MNVTILDTTIEIDETSIAESSAEISAQIREYERGERRAFDLHVDVPEGMTGDVMTAMLEIPYGETRTYGDLAADLETIPVAVGGACARNPVPLIVPCHRVVGERRRSARVLGGRWRGDETSITRPRDSRERNEVSSNTIVGRAVSASGSR